jgi:hypothetical protein
MAVTLVEVGAGYGKTSLAPGVTKIIAQNSPILDRLPQKQFKGNAYSQEIESALPLGQWRAVGGTYTRASGSKIKVTETVSILGREVFIDRYDLKVANNVKELKARKFQEVARGVALTYDQTFFEGSTHVDPLSFDGIRTRITGNQLLSAGDNGAALTLAMLDEMLDTVIAPEKLLYMNRTLRRKITTLAGAQANSLHRVAIPSLDKYGKQVTAYNEVPILLVERTDDGSTILDFDETRGSSDVTASVYCLSFGNEERLFGLMGADGEMDVHEVTDADKNQTAPGAIGRLEFYPGLMIVHPRCVARLRGITNA